MLNLILQPHLGRTLCDKAFSSLSLWFKCASAVASQIAFETYKQGQAMVSTSTAPMQSGFL